MRPAEEKPEAQLKSEPGAAALALAAFCQARTDWVRFLPFLEVAFAAK